MYLSDLHIHSRFSRATSRDCDLPHLDFWARRKGIELIGTGDFTHPAWRAELREQLVPAGEGVYTLREELRLPGASSEAPRFVVTGEISSIYKRGGQTRKVHNLLLLPNLEVADELSAKLETIGNIQSDGRPILGLDSRDLLEFTLETCSEAEVVPAHIWTPHFSMFGAFSDFHSVEDCFGDMTPYIHAIETGLSSDPPMNWRVSMLDSLHLLSNSDAHSPARLGREANLMEGEISYPALLRAVRTGEGLAGTVEFFPEEGKYHLDGHRGCGVCLTPSETKQLGGICPVCHRKLTIGVEHRVETMADRPVGYRPTHAKPFESLAPLPETIAASTGWSVGGKKTAQLYEKMLTELGPEFSILRDIPPDEIERVAGPCVAEGIRRLRLGQVERKAGFDGEYGVISLLSPSEIEQIGGQTSLFASESPHPMQPKRWMVETTEAKTEALCEERGEEIAAGLPNPEQFAAITAKEEVIAVVAGPGTGKTNTLVSRIAYLVEERGVSPSEITAVTFTNQAAAEMRARLVSRLGGARAILGMTIGTFHAICLRQLGKSRIAGRGALLEIASDLLAETSAEQTKKQQGSPKKLLEAISRVKNGESFSEAGVSEELFHRYNARLAALDVLDFDDLLLRALSLDSSRRKGFHHLLVDEFQDINITQYTLLQKWSERSKSLFVIGDPDQSIYGFRGASAACFSRLAADRPETRFITLTQNYRSTPQVLACARSVIEKNPGAPRMLVPTHPDGPAVRLVQANDEFSEAVFITKEIARIAGGVDMLEAERGG